MSTWTLKEKSTGDLEVVIDGEVWTSAVNKAFNKIAKNVTIKGFRKGNAPKALLEKQVSVAERQAQAIDDNANTWMFEALKENELTPISQPQLDIKEINDDRAVLVFTFAIEPTATVSGYTGLKYDLGDTSVSDEEYQAELDRMRKTYADMIDKDGEAADGDTVNIDYEGFKDGVAFDGGKADNYNLVLGSNSFIPGFEEQLIGTKAGDEKELNLTFPEEYHAEDLAGAEVVFKVKVNKVQEEVLPEVDDDFAKDINAKDVETVADLEKMIRERLETGKKNEAEQKADNELMDQFLEKIEVEIPDVMVEEEVQNQINQLAAQIQQYGISFSQYLQMMGKKPEELKEDYKEQAIKNVTLRLGLSAVAKAENLEVTDEEFDKQLEELATMYNMKPEDIKMQISDELLRNDIKNQKAYDFLKENAVKA